MLKDFRANKPQIHTESYISQNAVIIGRVNVARNVSVWPGCVLRADVDEIIVGEDTNVQDGVLIHTNYNLPAVIGKGTTIGHGAILHGCKIGNNCLIAMGAIILDGAVIEDDCIIGAGAVVTENAVIPKGKLVLGVPGRVVRSLTAEEINKNKLSAEEYKKLFRIYNE